MSDSKLTDMADALKAKHTPEDDPATSAVKPAWKSVEGWIGLLLSVAGAVMASGLLDPADPEQARVLKLLGVILALGAGLGFTASRTYTKAVAARGAVDVAIARVNVVDLAAERARRVPGLDRPAEGP